MQACGAFIKRLEAKAAKVLPIVALGKLAAIHQGPSHMIREGD
jgi:hypothetical protein